MFIWKGLIGVWIHLNKKISPTSSAVVLDFVSNNVDRFIGEELR